MTSRETYAALKPLIQEVALQLTKLTKSEWTLRKSEDGEYTYFHLDSGTSDVIISTANYGSGLTVASTSSTAKATCQTVRP